MKRLNRLVLLLMLLVSNAFSDVYSSDSFAIDVKTDNVGSSADNEFTIPIVGTYNYNYSVDCDRDGEYEEENLTTEYTCVYPVDANKNQTIVINGLFPHFHFYSPTGGDEKKLITIEQWGTQAWRTMSYSFFGASNLVYISTDTPNLSNVTNMDSMFMNANSLEFGNIANWDVSNVTIMTQMFIDAKKFDLNISSWDVSNVTSMSSMFMGCEIFNQDIGDWDVSSTKHMTQMFAGAEAFNQDISDWNVSGVTGMYNMFSHAEAFNQDINTWDVSNVTNMKYMFRNAISFNQNIGNWDVLKVKTIANMFQGAEVFNQDIGDWDVSNVTDMNYTFNGTIRFNQDIGDWDVSNVTGMKDMFTGVHLSVSDYDHILQEWSKLLLKNGVTFDAGNSHYCNGLAAKNAMISQHGWTINDAGENCDFYIDTPYLQTVQPGAPQKVVTLSTHSIGTDPVSYSIVGGSDMDKFFLSTPNGSELYIYSTDIDNPADNNKDNIYRVRIRAVSGSYSDQRTISVKVSNNSILVPIINYLLQ